MPYITSTVASAAVWSFLYIPDKGLINAVLTRLGLSPLHWLTKSQVSFNLIDSAWGLTLAEWAHGPSLALIALIIYTIWVFVGSDIAIFLAGLGNIPAELYDAAKVDGASVSVYKTTPEKELAAWFVIKFLDEKAQTTEWALATGYLPVRSSAKADVITALQKDPKWSAAANSYAKVFDWTQYAMIESPVAGYDPVRDIIDKKVLTPVVTDSSADPKKLLDSAVKESNGILKENAPK